MIRHSEVINWLALAALTDWLIARTLTRLAIYMPKSPPVIVIYQALGLAGQVATTLTSLLALGILSWIVWHRLRAGNWLGLSFAWPGLLILSLLSLFMAPPGWLALGYHLLLLAALAMAGAQLWTSKETVEKKIAGMLPGLALMTGGLYQLGPALYETLHWSGPPPFTGLLFNLGELFIILSAIALWWAYGRGASGRTWLGATIPALVFGIMYLVNPAMAGMLTIWSIGMTLYLPWPLYAASLWLAGVTVIVSFQRGSPAGWAILLLAAGGYAPQFSTQAFLGLIALWLLAPGMEESIESRLPVPEVSHIWT